MYYITVPQSPMYRQMSIEELLFGDNSIPPLINSNETNTKTYEVEKVSAGFKKNVNLYQMYETLKAFNEKTDYLREKPRNSLYHSFSIPKKSGGLRRIDAPCDDLMNALRMLKEIFEKDFHALYHTSAFAYVKGRSTVDAVKKHQQNESKWFAKFDLSNFFGSITPDFTMAMLAKIYPFSDFISFSTVFKEELRKALDLAFLNGGLPQGTPISPLLTNIIMIPIDFKLSNTLRNFENNKLVYTRYADDFLISSRYGFSSRSVENLVCETLSEFEAPFNLNREKTRYGSSAGSNWNLGLMLNKDNKITIGHQNKKRFQAMLTNYILDRRNGNRWEIADIQTLNGYKNYYKMVEGEIIERIIAHINAKFSSNVEAMIAEDLRNL